VTVRILQGDCRDVLRTLPDESVHCVVTSPPYFGLRDYGVCGQIGLESSPDAFVEVLVGVFSEIHRVLRKDGTVWLNLGDSYAGSGRRGYAGGKSTLQGSTDGQDQSRVARGSQLRAGLHARVVDGGVIGRAWVKPPEGMKPKNLLGIPWRVAFALQALGWYLRNEIIWAKPNGMPGSQEDRCTSSHETIFMLSKSEVYWSDFDAIKTPPRESTLVRLAQDVQVQAGSHRANGGAKTNGTMKAVGGTDKQRGHGRRHAGFNERWDKMEKSQQQAKPAMMRDVWFVSPAGFEDAHFAVMPEEIARRCIAAGCPEGGTVLDPFGGAGTTGLVADRLGRDAVLIELNPEYRGMIEKRIHKDAGMFACVAVR
jgi:DNA modification methylase